MTMQREFQNCRRPSLIITAGDLHTHTHKGSKSTRSHEGSLSTHREICQPHGQQTHQSRRRASACNSARRRKLAVSNGTATRAFRSSLRQAMNLASLQARVPASSAFMHGHAEPKGNRKNTPWRQTCNPLARHAARFVLKLWACKVSALC